MAIGATDLAERAVGETLTPTAYVGEAVAPA